MIIYLFQELLEKPFHEYIEGNRWDLPMKNEYSGVKEILFYIIHMCFVQPQLATAHLQGF